MEPENRTLYLFTAEYPFGSKSETFIETEIFYLSKAFKNVVIFPSFNSNNGIRELPSNVTINSARTNADFSGRKKWAALGRNFGLSIRIMLNESSHRNPLKVILNIKSLLDYLGQSFITAESLKPELAAKPDVILYDYWFVNSTLALSVLKAKGIIADFISRGHGFDVYDERNPPYGVSFRQWKMKWIKCLFVISKNGFDYLMPKTKKKYRSKIFLTRLGVNRQGSTPSNSIENKKVIVSCSNIFDFKRVHEIPLVLSKLNLPVKWIHFGDGPFRDEVQKNIELLPENISAELVGHRNNQQVIEFYSNHHVDLFLSLSTSEGLPVSMMESLSFGIPIVAKSAGGVREIVVTNQTGILLDVDQTTNDVALAIIKALNLQFDRNAIRAFFENEFEASKNYNNFIHQLYS